jgi:hypothetical protein
VNVADLKHQRGCGSEERERSNRSADHDGSS